jgi:hypothetical protein
MPRIVTVSSTPSPLYNETVGDDEFDTGCEESVELDSIQVGGNPPSQSQNNLNLLSICLQWPKKFLMCTSLSDFGFKLGSMVYICVLVSGYIVGRDNKNIAVKYATAACAALMVIWWLTEAVPLVHIIHKIYQTLFLSSPMKSFILAGIYIF